MDAYEKVSVTLTAADLLDLDNTPVELLPAPGGRFYYVIDRYLLHYRFGTTPYNETLGGSALQLVYGAGAPNSGTEIFPLSGSTSTGFDFNAPELFTLTEDGYLTQSLDFGQGYATWFASNMEDLSV